MNVRVQTAWSTLVARLQEPQTIRFILEGCIVVALLVTTIGERSLIASQRHIMPAGDVFNFQSIARQMAHFQYPIHEKRLPGFALTLLVGMGLGFDPTRVGIWVSIMSSAGSTLLLYLIGRRFKFPVLPLALCLLLTSVAPLLTINGVRPLSDSFFMFLIILSVYLTTIIRPTRASAITTGLVLTLLAFTRYEGIPTAGLMLLLLRIRVKWKYVFIAAAPLVIAVLLWLPVAKKVHGSLHEFGYFKDAQEIADVATIPSEYLRVIKTSGFGRAWAIQDIWAVDKQAQADAWALPTTADWWLSVLASFGVLWLLIAVRKKAWPLLVAFAFYPILPAWWFLYSRYVAPMTAFYFLCMAAGTAGVWAVVQWIHKRGRAPWQLQLFSAVFLTAILIKLVLGASPGLWKEAQARGWENNGNGYALYEAIMSLKDGPEHVAVSADYLMAYMMLGSVGGEADPLNNGRGVYLSAKPDATPAELAAYLQEKQTDILVDSGEKNVVPLVKYLEGQHVIDHTTSYSWPRQDGDIETANLHHLHWQ